MVSLTFLLILLPLGLLAYYLAPVGLRPGVLLGFSLFCFFTVQPWSLLLMLTTVTMDYLVLVLLHRFGENQRARRSLLCFSVVKNMVVILYSGAIMQGLGTQVVLGVLVYTLLGMDCVTAAYRGEIPAAQNPVHFGLYACFFPRLYAGPFQPYQEFRGQLDRLQPTPAKLLDGLGALLTGALKILLLGGYLSTFRGLLEAAVASEATVITSWMLALTLALQMFYQLSGYCDMARGIGMMFGLTLPRSFYYPYQSRGINDFFQRFHATLWALLNRTISPALDDGKSRPVVGTLNLVVLGMLFGIWFDLRIQYLVWGGFLALFAAAENYLFQNIPLHPPVLLRRAYNFLVVIVSFSLLCGGTLLEGITHFGNLFFPAAVPVFNNRAIYLLSTNWVLLLVGLFFATNAASLVSTWGQKAFPRLARGLGLVTDLLLLVVVVALLA